MRNSFIISRKGKKMEEIKKLITKTKGTRSTKVDTKTY